VGNGVKRHVDDRKVDLWKQLPSEQDEQPGVTEFWGGDRRGHEDA
jgi:hypothetical protein